MSKQRFSSPSDCWAIFVGCSPLEFLGDGAFGVEEAVERYCGDEWPWDDESPTEEIKQALIAFLNEYLEGK